MVKNKIILSKLNPFVLPELFYLNYSDQLFPLEAVSG